MTKNISPKLKGFIDQKDIRGDGRVILYKRRGLKNPRWQTRIRVPNSTGYRIVSTKSEDLVEAIQFATNLYDELDVLVKSGGSLDCPTFEKVFEDWKRDGAILYAKNGSKKFQETKNRVQTTALKFFSAKKINDITESDFENYWIWRKVNYSQKPPSDSTLLREKSAIIPIFKHALKHGHISQIPKINPPKSQNETGTTFTLIEWRKITRNMREWEKQSKGKATYRDRFLARNYFLILANTGMRIGELRDVRWKDTKYISTNKGKLLVAAVHGKTGSREVIFQKGADRYVERIRDARKQELGKDPDQDEYIICAKNGKTIGSFKRSFYSLLKYSGVQKSDGSQNRTIYSLRHFYATQRLLNNIGIFPLAKQMGTSVEMIEKVYGHVVSSDFAEEIVRTRN